MADDKVSDDDVEKMLSEIYRQANMEMDESAIRMMQEISRKASNERRSQEVKRPSDILFQSHLRTLQSIEEKQREAPPNVVYSGSGSDDIEEPSSSYSRHSRSYSGSRSPSRRGSRSYSGSRSPSRSGSRSYSRSKSYSQSRSGSDSRSYSKSQSGSRRDSASRSYSKSRSGSRSYSDSKSHSRSAKSSSRSGDSRSSRASRGSQSRSRRSSSHSRDSRSYSRSRSPGDSRSSYSSRGSRSSGTSRSYYSQELSPKRRPEPLLPDQESKPEEGGNSWFTKYLFPRTFTRSRSPSLNDKEDDDESEASAGGRCCTPAAMAFVLCILIAVGLGIGLGIDAANKPSPPAFGFLNNQEDCREYALYGNPLIEMAKKLTGDLQECLDLCAPYDAAAFGNFTECGCYNMSQCKLRWGDEVDSSNFIGTIYSKRPLQECEQDFCKTVPDDGRCFTGNTQPYSSYSLFGSILEEVASSNDVNNKDECLDFCRTHDAAQFLNFQDPKCKCFSGAECWLPWPNDQTETNGVEYTGDVYSKKKLQFCSFDYCSQFADSQLCAARNNR